MSPRAAVLPAIATALLAGATPAWGQGTGVLTGSSPDGWIGISYAVETVADVRGARTSVVITDVSEGSPAARAGVVVGDVLVSINGISYENGLDRAADRIRLSPGDAVRLVVARDGRTRPVRVIAARRPARGFPLSSTAFPAQGDSIVEVMFKAMDSLRIQLVRDAPLVVSVSGALPAGGRSTGETHVVVAPRAAVGARDVPGAFPSGVGELPAPEMRAPFGFFLFRGESYDSLRREMEELNGQIRAARLRESELMRMRAELSRSATADAELARLRRTMAEHVQHGVELRRAMDDAARAQAAKTYSFTWEAQDASEQPSGFRPLTPYVLGQDRAAGAQVVELKPELAAYFSVASGVLVVDVPQGTPAAVAGVRPGDVITQVGGEPVRSIDDVRRGLARGGDAVRISLVRRGDRLEVVLKR